MGAIVRWGALPLILLILVLFGSSLWAEGLKKEQVSYAKHRVTFADGQQYDFYVIRPRFFGRTIVSNGVRETSGDRLSVDLIHANGKQAERYLRQMAKHILADAKKNGYLEGESGDQYRKELRKLSAGYWPAVMVTPAEDAQTILMTFAYAIRWKANESLPFVDRFVGKGIEGLPDQIISKAGLSEPNSHHAIYRFNGNQIEWDAFLTEIASLRRWMIGEMAEVKFLTATEDKNIDTFRFLPVIHALSRLYELHRWSMTPLPIEIRDEYIKFGMKMRKDSMLGWQARALLSMAVQVYSPPFENDFFNRRLWEEFFFEHLFDPALQPSYLNSNLYFQVSGRSRGGGRATARKRAFIKKMGFPKEPEWEFEEQAPWGTPGVRTSIFKLTISQYEEHIGASLNASAGFTMENRPGVELNVTPTWEGSPNCVRLISYLAKQALEYEIMKAVEVAYGLVPGVRHSSEMSRSPVPIWGE